MKVLLVSSYLPFPLFSGGHVRLFNILKELSKNNEITLVCEKRKHQTQRDVDEVKKFCKDIFIVERKKQWSPEVIFQTAMSSLPFLLAGHKLPEMEKILTELLQNKSFDIIHVETFYVMQNLPTTTLPIVLVEHNIEYSVYGKFAAASPLLLRPFLQIDVEKIKYWEKKCWQMATKVVGVSQVEAQEMRSDAEVIQNGVNLSEFPFKKSVPKRNEKTILFMGDFKWIQNRNAAVWILRDIWPRIEEDIKGKALSVKLWIVGKNIPSSFREYNSDTIVLDEHAPDKTSEIYQKADILLAPIKVGGGTSYKILEAMACGVPVVTTVLGIAGLQAVAGTHALVGESVDALVQHVMTFATNEKKYDNIRKNARAFVEKHYSWIEIVKKLERVYADAVRK